MATFDDFITEFGSEIKALVAKSWAAFGPQAAQDAKDFLDKSKADLERWTKLLSAGSLSVQDFEFLLAAEKDLAELTALKQAGLAQIQLDRFINDVVGVIINAATKVFT